MRVQPGHLPKLQCHGPRRQARVKLAGQDVYLGDFDDPDVKGRYEQVIALWLSNARQWPPPSSQRMMVEVLGDLFLAFTDGYYVKGDRPTAGAAQARRAIELLYRAGLAQVPVAQFTPQQLKAFQRYLCACCALPEGEDKPVQLFARRTINTYVHLIVMMFRWAVTEGHAEESVWRSLQAVFPLKRGRIPAPDVPAPREGGKVYPVPQAVLDATLAKARPMLRAMMELQLATAMRPAEVVALRPCDLVRTIEPGVFAYRVAASFNKLDHHEIDRVVYIGPRGMTILRPWLRSPAGTPEGVGFVFCPREAREQFDAQRRAGRKSKCWPSHSSAARKARKIGPEAPPAGPGDHYTTASYGRAIARAAAAAGVERWGPNRLRHNAATYIAAHERLEVAQLLLGHRHIATTMKYVTVSEGRAVSAALKLG